MAQPDKPDQPAQPAQHDEQDEPDDQDHRDSHAQEQPDDHLSPPTRRTRSQKGEHPRERRAQVRDSSKNILGTFLRTQNPTEEHTMDSLMAQPAKPDEQDEPDDPYHTQDKTDEPARPDKHARQDKQPDTPSLARTRSQTRAHILSSPGQSSTTREKRYQTRQHMAAASSESTMDRHVSNPRDSTDESEDEDVKDEDGASDHGGWDKGNEPPRDP